MRTKNLITSLIIPVSIFLTATASFGARKDSQQGESGALIIPEEVQLVFKQGMETRQPRLDIPFSVVKHLYLPAQQNLHSIFLFKVKNSDLGLVSASPTKNAEKTEIESPSGEAAAPQQQVQGHVFLQFNQLDGTYYKQVYVPIDIQEDGKNNDPDQEKLFSIGYPMPHGKYLLSMAIASQNLEKIGTQYVEFILPDPQSFTEELGMTPVFFVNKMNRMAAPEITTHLHQDFFTYSVLQIVPNLEKIFSPNDNLDVFFYIFGTRPNEQGVYDIDIQYSVMEGEEEVIHFAAQKCTRGPIISQPLPMKKTLVVKTTTSDGETKERTETKDLEPGSYALSIDIKDNVSGKSIKESINFEVQ